VGAVYVLIVITLYRVQTGVRPHPRQAHSPHTQAPPHTHVCKRFVNWDSFIFEALGVNWDNFVFEALAAPHPTHTHKDVNACSSSELENPCDGIGVHVLFFFDIFFDPPQSSRTHLMASG
jgi:hypothetical protein